MIRIDNVNDDKKLTYAPKERDWSKQHVSVTTRVFTEQMSWYDGEEKVTVKQIKETEKAIQFKFSHYEADWDETTETIVWLPKSQITETEDGIEIPVWLAKEKGLLGVTFEKSIITPKGE